MTDPPATSFAQRHAAKLPFVVAAIVWVGWAIFMQREALWGLFQTEWFMSVTMAFGSFIAGATSEGGGAVAFPVMTLFFKIPPAVARDFSLMIQAFGMTAASLLIIVQGIKVEWRAILWGGIGGGVGIALGLTSIAPLVAPPVAKLFFTSLWLAFAVALYLINRHHDRETKTKIEGFEPKHAATLFGIGILGGIVSSITGSGLDIITFSLLVLAFRLSESIATPTSVILMASNAVAGFFWKGTFLGGMEAEAFAYWYVCIPVVVIGAPLGARFIKNRSRLTIATILYASIAIQFTAALFIIPLNPLLVTTIVVTFSAGTLMFWLMAKAGSKRLMEYA